MPTGLGPYGSTLRPSARMLSTETSVQVPTRSWGPTAKAAVARQKSRAAIACFMALLHNAPGAVTVQTSYDGYSPAGDNLSSGLRRSGDEWQEQAGPQRPSPRQRQESSGTASSFA